MISVEKIEEGHDYFCSTNLSQTRFFTTLRISDYMLPGKWAFFFLYAACATEIAFMEV